MNIRIPLRKDRQIVEYAMLTEITELDGSATWTLPPGPDPWDYTVVGLRRGRPAGRFYVVRTDELGRAFPKRWRPA